MPKHITDQLEDLGLPVSTFRATSQKSLIARYGLDPKIIKMVKEKIDRQPIDPEVVTRLLHNSAMTCCCCRGAKSDSFLIHHIIEYAISQDNSYENLAVLCPACHDSAHTVHKLSENLNPGDIRRHKQLWEEAVKKLEVEKACRIGEVGTIDYVNIPRIMELAKKYLDSIPDIDSRDYLARAGILDRKGNLLYLPKEAESSNYLIRPMLVDYYYEVFKTVLARLDFSNLDDLLKMREIQRSETLGKLCYYVGGLYGKKPILPITSETKPLRLYFKRKRFIAEWWLDPKYIFSNTSAMRMGGRNVFLIYGVIRNITGIMLRDRHYITISIMPFAAGLPAKSIDRTPVVHYLKNPFDWGEEDDGDDNGEASEHEE